jgi:hypothetical protein
MGRPEHVRRDGLDRLGIGKADERLGGEMEDDLRPEITDGGAQRRAVADVAELRTEAAAEAEAGRLREVTGRSDSTFAEYAKAMQGYRPLEGVDGFMENTLRGEELTQYKAERMAERVNRVQYEADRRVEQLHAVVSLDETQQDKVFALMARSSPDFDPGMQMEGLGDDRATLAQGQSRDEAILAVLRPEQRTIYEDHRASQRQQANEEMAEVGLKLPDDWDMFSQ